MAESKPYEIKLLQYKYIYNDTAGAWDICQIYRHAACSYGCLICRNHADRGCHSALLLLLLLLPGGYLHAEIFLGEGDEVLNLGVIQEAVAVLVGPAKGAAAPQAAEPGAAAADRLPELVPADPAVAVGVKLLEPPLELLQRHVLAVGGGAPAPDRHGWHWQPSRASCKLQPQD